MDPVAIALLAAGGVVIALDQAGNQTAGATPAAAATATERLKASKIPVFKTLPASAAQQNRIASSIFSARGDGKGTGSGAEKPGTPTGFPAEVEALLKKKMTDEWNKMSGTAKGAACQALKAQYPNDPSIQSLNCSNAASMAFQAILAVAAAAAAGGLCGPACSAIALVAVAIFGPKLEEWGVAAWDEIKDVGEWFGDKAEEAWDWVF